MAESNSLSPLKGGFREQAATSKLRRQHGGYALLSAVAATALFTLLNLAFMGLENRVSLDIDMTTQGVYTPAPEAVAYLRDLSVPVEITTIQEESRFDPRTLEALENYARISAQISYQNINIDRNPAFAGRFPGETLGDDSIVIQSGEKYRVLSESDLYYLTSQNGYPVVAGLKIDQKLCSAILAVTTARQPVACFLQGHGESEMQELSSLLESTGRILSTVNLMTQAIPDEADTLLICEPLTDFDSLELKRIEDFLLLGDKTVLLLLDAQVGELPALSAFASEWGIGISNDIVIDDSRYWGGNSAYLLAGYQEDQSIVSSLAAAKINTIMPLSRSLRVQAPSQAGCTAFPILWSFETAYSKGIGADTNTLERSEEDPGGPFLLGMGSTKEWVQNSEPRQSTLFVYGSAAMASSSVLSAPSLGNREIVRNTVTYGRAQPDTADIPALYLADASLDITSTQVSFWRILLIAILPAAIASIGFGVWRRREAR